MVKVGDLIVEFDTRRAEEDIKILTIGRDEPIILD